MTAAPAPPDLGLERLPPQAVDIEQAVLSAMLLAQEGTERGLDLLAPADFYHGPHARIHDAIRALYERNVAVDQLTLAEELRRRGQLEEVGGVVYLAELAGLVGTAGNVTYHAGIVAEKATQRAVIDLAAEATSRAYEGRTASQDLLDQLQSGLFTLAERRQKGGTLRSMQDVLTETTDHIDRVHQMGGGVTGVDTGLCDLNDMTSGFQPGDLILMAARPSVGKTALALCIALHAARCGLTVAVFSLEMSCQQLGQRLLCIETGANLHRMRKGRLEDDDWLQITRHVGKLADVPLYVDDTAGLSVLEVRTRARQLQRQHGLGLVVVDYLQLMTSGTRTNSEEQEVSHISRGLKGLAKELGVPVLALSQLSRAPEARSDRRPQLSDLRYSGSLEQDADVVMFVYRPDMYGIKGEQGQDLDGVAEIIVGKQRQGPTGSVHLAWDPHSVTFANLAPEYRHDVDQSRLGLD